MTITDKLEPLDYAMGYIRQLDDPENGENYHPYYARLTSLALPIFELYAAMYKIVTTPYPLVLKISGAFVQGFTFLWSKVSEAILDIRDNGLNAREESWMTLTIMSINLFSALALGAMSIMYGTIPLFFSLALPTVEIVAIVLLSLLISSEAIFLLLNPIIICSIIKVLENPLMIEELAHSLKRLFIDPSLHLCNMTLSPLIGLISPSTNDAYHQATGLITPIPSNIHELEEFIEGNDENTTLSLLSHHRITRIVRSELHTNTPSPFLSYPSILTYLHGKNIDLFKRCLLNYSSNLWALDRSDISQFSETIQKEVIGYIFFQQSKQVVQEDSPYHAFIEKLRTDDPQGFQEQETAGLGLIVGDSLSIAEKVELFVKPESVLLISQLLDYLKTMRKVKSEEVINGFKKLKGRYPGIQTELKKLEESLTHPLFPAIDNDRFSDLLIYTES